MQSILSYEFMQNALMAGIMASIVCGVIGPFIVTKRMVFISGGLTHAAFGGLGIAYWLGIRPLYGATVFVLCIAAILSRLEGRTDKNDLFVGILWAVGVAIGIIFIHMTPGYAPDLMTFLFGNILTVPRSDIVIMLILTLAVVVPIVTCYKGFVSIALDEEYARARQLPVNALNTGLMMLVALAVVTLIQVVGIILVIALLTIPVAIAGELSLVFRRIMLLSILCGIMICLTGLSLSYSLEVPSGASIIITGAVFLGFVKSIRRLFSRRRSVAEGKKHP